MIDRFIVGRVTRISPEAPVPVVHFEREYSRLGGAANVAQNLRALGARVTLIGVVGADAAADRLGALLDSSGISRDGVVVDRTRPTTEKVRIVTDRNQQVARIDYEHDLELEDAVRAEVVAHIETQARSAHALLVSDYLKGAITADCHAGARRAQDGDGAAGRRPEDSPPGLLRRRDDRDAESPRGGIGDAPPDQERAGRAVRRRGTSAVGRSARRFSSPGASRGSGSRARKPRAACRRWREKWPT